MVNGVKCSSRVEQAYGRYKSTDGRQEEIVVDFQDNRLSTVMLRVCWTAG